MNSEAVLLFLPLQGLDLTCLHNTLVRLKQQKFASLLQIDHGIIILLQRGIHALRLDIIKIFSFMVSYSFQSKVNTAQSTLPILISDVSRGVVRP